MAGYQFEMGVLWDDIVHVHVCARRAGAGEKLASVWGMGSAV
jgi:hypothetical protein